jgi:hypothetical protein
MKRLMQVLGALCLLPYGYVGWYWVHFWLFAETSQIDAHMLLYTVVLIGAAPFIMAFFAIRASVANARSMRSGLEAQSAPEVARSSAGLWVSVVVAVGAVAASYQIYSLLFPEVEEGRDRLGRICEREGNRTVCRPDPERQRSTIDMLNEKRQAQ